LFIKINKFSVSYNFNSFFVIKALIKYKFKYFNALIANYSLNGLSSIDIDNNFKTESFKIIYKYFGLWGLLLKLTNPLQNLIKKIN